MARKELDIPALAAQYRDIASQHPETSLTGKRFTKLADQLTIIAETRLNVAPDQVRRVSVPMVPCRCGYPRPADSICFNRRRCIAPAPWSTPPPPLPPRPPGRPKTKK